MWFHTGFLYLFSCFSVVILVSLSLAVLLHTCALPPPGYSPLSHFPTLSQMLPHLMHFSHLSCLGFHHLSGVDAPRLFCVQAFPTTHLCASYLPCMCFPSLHMLTSLSRASPLLCSPPPCASVLLVLLSLCKHASPVSCFPMRFPPHALPPSHCTPSQSLIMLFLSPCCAFSISHMHFPCLVCTLSPPCTHFHLHLHASPLLIHASTFCHTLLPFSHVLPPSLTCLSPSLMPASLSFVLFPWLAHFHLFCVFLPSFVCSPLTHLPLSLHTLPSICFPVSHMHFPPCTCNFSLSHVCFSSQMLSLSHLNVLCLSIACLLSCALLCVFILHVLLSLAFPSVLLSLLYIFSFLACFPMSHTFSISLTHTQIPTNSSSLHFPSVTHFNLLPGSSSSLMPSLSHMAFLSLVLPSFILSLLLCLLISLSFLCFLVPDRLLSCLHLPSLKLAVSHLCFLLTYSLSLLSVEFFLSICKASPNHTWLSACLRPAFPPS